MVGGLPNSALWTIEYEDLVFKEIIGKGNFGCVYKGSYLGVEVAIKQIPSFDDPDYCKYTEREVKALRYIRHPLVVHFFGACKHVSGFYLITEFIEGLDLRRYLKSVPKPPRWLSRVNIALGVAKTFLFLHSKNILHRDLKSKNILLDISRNQIKVCDFGFARVGSQYSNGSDSSSSEDESEEDSNGNGGSEDVYKNNGNGRPANYRLRRMSICGTPFFMAPEILLQQKYDWSIDVFSFGILLSELLTLKRPGKDYWIRNQNNGFDISVEELSANIPSPNDCPIQFYDLTLKCCSYKHTNRPKFSTIINILESIKDQLELSDNNNSINNNNNNNSIQPNINNNNNSIVTLNSNSDNNNEPHNTTTTTTVYTNNKSILQPPPSKQQQQQSTVIKKNNLISANSNLDSSIVTAYPISTFKERKKQSLNKILRVNTLNILNVQQQQQQQEVNSNNNEEEQQQQQNLGSNSNSEREGVIKLNTTKYPNGWKEFGINNSNNKIWIIYQSNIIKIGGNSGGENINLIEITCGTILKLKKHSITLSTTDSNLVSGINIINVKSYLKDYPHIHKPIKANSNNNNNSIYSNLELKLIIKLQSRIRGWLVKRRYKIFLSNWKLNNSNTLQSNKRQWINLFNQLIESELDYKKQLDQIIKSYLLPIQSKFRINKPLLNYKEINSIFSNIESLSEIHSELLKIVNQISNSPYFIINFENEKQQLLKQEEDTNNTNGGEFTNISINTKDSNSQINSITQFIVKNISQIKNQYGIYAFNFKYQTNIYNWCKLNPDFSKFIETIRIGLNNQFPEQENDLVSLLSLPINKIQKYLLIFEKLQQITPITHSEYKDIKSAFTLIRETSNYIQSQLEMSFEHSHIMSIDVMLQKKDNQSLIQSGRWFVKQGLFNEHTINNTNNTNNKQYYLFLLSDICLITKPVKSKSSKQQHKELNLSTSINHNNSTITPSPSPSSTVPTTSNSNSSNNMKYYYRLKSVINLKDEVSMRINPEIPNGVIFMGPNKIYKWLLNSEEEARDWVNEFERTSILIYRNNVIGNGSGSGSGAVDLSEINQIQSINNQNIPTPTNINNMNSSGEKGFIRRFRLSFSAASGTPSSDRNKSLSTINNTDSSNNSPTTPIKSVLSSPSIHYIPSSSSSSDNQQEHQQLEEFQFAIPTTPSDKKKKRVSISSKLKRLSVTFSSPTSGEKRNKDFSRG